MENIKGIYVFLIAALPVGVVVGILFAANGTKSFRRLSRRFKKAYDKQDYDAVIKICEKILKKYPDNFNGRYTYWKLLVHLCIKTGEEEKALKNCEEMLELFPDNCYALNSAGYCLLNNGEDFLAYLCWLKVRALDECDGVVWANIGKYYLLTGKPDKAAEHIERSLRMMKRQGLAEKYPTQFAETYAVIFANLAVAYNLLGRHEDARAVLDAARGYGCENIDEACEKVYGQIRQREGAFI